GEEVAGGAAVLDVHRQGELVHPVEHPHRECRVLGLPTSGQRHTPFGFVTGGLHGGPACESEVVAVSGDVLGSAVLEVVSGHEVGFIGVLRRHGGGHGPGTGRQRTRGQRSQGDPAPGAGTAAAWRSPGRVRCCTHQQPSPSYDAELSPSALVTVTVPPGTVSVRELKAADVARPGSSSVTVRLPKSVEIVTSTGSSPVLATRAVT